MIVQLSFENLIDHCERITFINRKFWQIIRIWAAAYTAEDPTNVNVVDISTFLLKYETCFPF